MFNCSVRTGEIRMIQINKKDERETLGFSVETGRGGGAYISTMSDTSLAARMGLMVGDRLLDVRVHARARTRIV
jgi:hypothetical protein